MAQKTAVEWLVEQTYKKEWYTIEKKFIIEQAKQMEREQIVNAHLTGLIRPLEIEATKQAEQYYNETYGSRLQNETN